MIDNHIKVVAVALSSYIDVKVVAFQGDFCKEGLDGADCVGDVVVGENPMHNVHLVTCSLASTFLNLLQGHGYQDANCFGPHEDLLVNEAVHQVYQGSRGV